MASNPRVKPEFDKPDTTPLMVLYVSAGDDTGPGKVYQVDENGRVLGLVHLPFTATGLAMHRQHGLIATIPRDGGKLMRIDDTGKVETILAKEPSLVHPVRVAVGADSDTIVVADDIAHTLSATSAGGIKPKVFQQLEADKFDRPAMSVAVTKDKRVILGTNSLTGKKGILRYSGDDHTASRGPILAEPGGVAADPATLMWAATQGRNQIYVMEGEEIVKTLRLPPNKSHYRSGMLSFAPCHSASSLVVLARPSDEPDGEPWFLQYGTKDEDLRSLFPWKYERIADFVVGPRMLWERKSPEKRSGSLY